jgi:septal ring factor EnvC (AmiA/AmiB activator)
MDHGERYLSVYARLAASLVEEGANLLPGDPVGMAGEADLSGKALIYLEIRHHGKALDPIEWLRRIRR